MGCRGKAPACLSQIFKRFFYPPRIKKTRGKTESFFVCEANNQRVQGKNAFAFFSCFNKKPQ